MVLEPFHLVLLFEHVSRAQIYVVLIVLTYLSYYVVHVRIRKYSNHIFEDVSSFSSPKNTSLRQQFSLNFSPLIQIPLFLFSIRSLRTILKVCKLFCFTNFKSGRKRHLPENIELTANCELDFRLVLQKSSISLEGHIFCNVL